MYKSILIAAATLLLAACDIETSGNGNLDGYWHAVSADTLATQGRADLSQKRLFWAIQNHLVVMTDYDNQAPNLVAHFSYDDKHGSLTIYDFHYYDRMNGDPDITDSTQLYMWYIDSDSTTLTVEHLSQNSLTLATKDFRVKFEKF